jgi:hypothetical protein
MGARREAGWEGWVVLGGECRPAPVSCERQLYARLHSASTDRHQRFPLLGGYEDYRIRQSTPCERCASLHDIEYPRCIAPKPLNKPLMRLTAPTRPLMFERRPSVLCGSLLPVTSWNCESSKGGTYGKSDPGRPSLDF